jgi:flotillin
MLELIGGVTLMVILYSYFLLSRYKRCPADKILVVSGKTGGGDSTKIYTGGGVFVWPVIQDFAYLDRTPLKIPVEDDGTLNKEGKSIAISGAFVIAIGNTKLMLEAAANRLLTLNRDQIIDLSKEVINGQLSLVVNALGSVEINDQKQFIDAIYVGVNKQLKNFGLQLLNVDLKKVQVNKRNTAGITPNTSTEELGSQSETVELALRRDQIDELLNGVTVKLRLPGGERSIELSTPPTTN